MQYVLTYALILKSGIPFQLSSAMFGSTSLNISLLQSRFQKNKRRRKLEKKTEKNILINKNECNNKKLELVR